jgi:hypothetical protein
MLIVDYASLITAVGDFLNRADAGFTARIPDFIGLAESRINRTLRTRKMEATVALSVASEFVALPPDYLEALALTITDGSVTYNLEQVRLERIAESKGYEGATPAMIPRYYALNGLQLQIYPAPDKAYAGLLTYAQKIPSLSLTNTTNWLLTQYPDIYLYGALWAAAPYIRDADGLTMWEELFTKGLKGVRDADHEKGGLLRTDVPRGPHRYFNILADR